MSDLLSQRNPYITYGETSMIARQVFRCLDCEQYVVFLSNLPNVAPNCSSLPTLDTPCSEAINKSDLSQRPFSYDFNSFQSIFSSDSSDLIQPVTSSSDFPNPIPFFPTDLSEVPFSQDTDISMTGPLYNAYDTSNYKATIDTDQNNKLAVLRSEAEQIQTLQQSHADDNIPISSVRSITQYDKSMETLICTDDLQNEVLNMSAQLQKATCERDNLEKRLREVEDYLPSLVSWAVETTQALDRLKNSHKTKKPNKRLTRA